ncbi:hypothetical protein [Kistimonas asteriae]|uniref:hypothetical protein n=1 Tax=Kistimonas asteriae TaxID=517724 RepID=UPI001BAC4F9D|nr:hypothetical protein [Kistimonas asteriae]
MPYRFLVKFYRDGEEVGCIEERGLSMSGEEARKEISANAQALLDMEAFVEEPDAFELIDLMERPDKKSRLGMKISSGK